jgi:hypothetical protein
MQKKLLMIQIFRYDLLCVFKKEISRTKTVPTKAMLAIYISKIILLNINS